MSRGDDSLPQLCEKAEKLSNKIKEVLQKNEELEERISEKHVKVKEKRDSVTMLKNVVASKKEEVAELRRRVEGSVRQDLEVELANAKEPDQVLNRGLPEGFLPFDSSSPKKPDQVLNRGEADGLPEGFLPFDSSSPAQPGVSQGWAHLHYQAEEVSSFKSTLRSEGSGTSSLECSFEERRWRRRWWFSFLDFRPDN